MKMVNSPPGTDSSRVKTLFKAVITPPRVDDEQQNLLAQTLHYLLILAVFLSGGYAVLTSFIADEPSGAILSGGMMVISGFLFWLLRQGRIQLVSRVLVISAYLAIMTTLFMNGGVRDEAALVLIALLSIAGFLWGMRVVIPLGALTAVLLIIIFWAERLQLIPEEEHLVPVATDELVLALIAVFVTTIILYQIARQIIQNNEKIEAQARFVNEKNRQLEATQQALIVAKEQAEEANRSRSVFFSRISHDFRTPLSSILGLTTHLQHHESALTLAERQELLQAIEHSGTHLLNLINDLLDISRLEAKELTLNSYPFVLSAVVSNVTSMLRVMAEDKGLQLRLHIDDALPEIIEADEQRLKQILINLVGNGIKFTQEGEVALWVTAVSHPTPAIRFEVKDTGCGIAPEDLDKIFAPFVQIGDKQQFAGTGLGLAISKYLVEAMGSTLHMKSQQGEGSSFWFELPITKI